MEFNANAGIDLHIHSNASDGSLSPSDILSRVQALNLRAISITDHDTLEGSRAAASAPIPQSIKFLTGVEISAAPPTSTALTGSFHILGYGICLDDPALNKALVKLQAARRDRNPQIIRRLNEIGCRISLEELQEEFGKSQLGRPHIAQIMVRNGFVKTINEAFDEFIGKGGPAYIDKYRLKCSEAIQIIRNAGGIAILAHPYLLKTTDKKTLENIIITLKNMGMEGIEVYYPEHTPEDTVTYIELARQHHLLMTGGTDFHGAINPDIEMGVGRGGFHVPYKLYESVVRSCSARGQKK
ncbi:MAG TPA: PHP domain-containing protein [Deltaproteobacteria bacterium]|nr:PHP domain-containing protein [Deltaproteobacteria bacterium]